MSRNFASLDVNRNINSGDAVGDVGTAAAGSLLHGP